MRAVLGLSRSVCSCGRGHAVAMVTRSPGARRREVLMTPAKYEVDRSTGGEVMGIFCKLRN